jgi:hypothetical protein
MMNDNGAADSVFFLTRCSPFNVLLLQRSILMVISMVSQKRGEISTKIPEKMTIGGNGTRRRDHKRPSIAPEKAFRRVSKHYIETYYMKTVSIYSLDGLETSRHCYHSRVGGVVNAPAQFGVKYLAVTDVNKYGIL